MTQAKSTNHNVIADIDEGFIEVLKNNPTLFQRYPELLELVQLSDSRGTASLLEKQVETLQSSLKSLRAQQNEFFAMVRENEQISDSFSDIIYKLIGFQNLSEFAAEFPQSLRTTFDIDEVSVKTKTAVLKREDELAQYQSAIERLPAGDAVCDNRWPRAILALFFSEQIQSAALVPMRHPASKDIIGILALGSKDSQRYTHELGTAHLSRLGVMAGICLQRLQLKP